MPSTSAKQSRFMQAIARSPAFSKKVGVAQSVGKDFSAADKGDVMKKGKRYEAGGGVESRLEEKAPTTKTGPYIDPRVAVGLKGMKWLKEKFNLPDLRQGQPDAEKKVEKVEKPEAKGMKFAHGGSVSSTSSRGDGIAQRGKTRG